MIPRRITPHLRSLLRQFPAVALVGPRQSGKTTLARTLSSSYFDLEHPQDRLRLDVRWADLVQTTQLVVLDEAQAMPEVFPRLRSAIDANRKTNGRFLVLGSISPVLMTQVSQSLAGRLAICELSPLLVTEVGATRMDRLWRFGGYPDGGILDDRAFPLWQKNYLSLMAQRDLPQWGLPAGFSNTERLFDMVAAVHGQTWNASRIGKSLGLSYHTVNHYLDYLEKAFLIRRLAPFSKNIGKRLTKSPKVYWRDSGLLHTLLRWEPDIGEIFSRVWVGASWEGWVIEQVISHLQSVGKRFEAWFLRTQDEREIDLLLLLDGRLVAIEVKLTSVPDARSLENLKKKAALVNADHCLLISRTTEGVHGRTASSLDLMGTLEWLHS